MSRALAFALVLLAGLLASACDHGQEMDNQPRYKSLRPLPGPFAQPAQPPVPGTVARGMLEGPVPKALPVPVTMDLLRRGQERFEIYCVPCHSPLGDGDGMVARRGFPHPPSYHSPRLRAVSDGYLFRVITEGYGIMYPYGNRVPPPDRWAIVAYIRALQLSQYTAAGPALESGARP